MMQRGILLVLLLSLLLLSVEGWQLHPSQHHLFRPTPSSTSSYSSFYHSIRHALAPRRRRLPVLFSTFPPLSPGDALNGGEAEKEGKGVGGGGGEGGNNNEDGKNEEELAAFLNLRKNDRGGTPIDSAQLVLEVLPYLCLQAESTIVGSSAYVTALRKKILEAAKDPERKPVVLLGDAGMRRVDTAVLLHSLTAPNQLPALRMSAKEITGEPARFFGGKGGRSLTTTGEGLLDLACDSSAVIVTKVESLQPHLLARLQQLVNEGTYSSVEEDSEGAAAEGPLKKCRPRILLTGQTLPPGLTLKKGIKTIQLLPLKKHRADVQPEVMQVLGRLCDEVGKPVPEVSESAYRFLTAYDFPGNLEELEMLVTDALNKIWRRGGPNEINENDLFDKAFDVQRANLRNNLFETVPWLRQFLRDIDWPKGLNTGFTRYAFPIYVAGLFLGPQDRDHNILLQGFWAWWWPAIMVIYPVLARIWCSVCPFMIYGEWAQETLLKIFPTYKLKKWPKSITDKWGPWFMYGLFVAILYWEELWDLPQNANLSAWLLLLITGGAIITSLQYEKRLWCHTLCPIGGMNGMYAKLSILSVRTEPGLCQSCGQYLCINNEKNNKPGCPLNLIPSQLADNSECVNCLQCATDNCPYDNVGLYIRPLAVDISSGSHQARDWEVCLMLLLMGNVFMRRLPQILTTLHLPLSWLESFPTHAAATTVALFIPAVITYGAHLAFQAPRIGSSVRLTNELKPAPTDFVRLAYGYLPLAWAANTASWGEFFLREAPNAIPVAAMSVGISADTAYAWLPHFTLSNDLVAFLQIVTLFIGAASSIWLTNAITHRSLKEMLPQIVTILGLDFLFAVSVLGPGPPWH